MARYPTLYAGQRFTAELASSMLPLFGAKSGTTDRTSTTTVTADPDLQVEVEASAEYELTFMLRISGNQTGRIDIQFTTPTGATGSFSCTRLVSTATADSGDATEVRSSTRLTYNVETTFSPISTTAHQVLIGSGRLITASTAGIFSVDWAQNVSNGTATSMHSDSFIKLVRIA